WAAAILANYQGDAGAVRRYGPASLAAAQAAGDPATLARAMYVDAGALFRVEPAAARARYRETLAFAEEIADVPMIAASSNDLGQLARLAGDHAEATAYYERAHELWRE